MFRIVLNVNRDELYDFVNRKILTAMLRTAIAKLFWTCVPIYRSSHICLATANS
jgi:hypothetical protein